MIKIDYEDLRLLPVGAKVTASDGSAEPDETPDKIEWQKRNFTGEVLGQHEDHIDVLVRNPHAEIINHVHEDTSLTFVFLESDIPSAGEAAEKILHHEVERQQKKLSCRRDNVAVMLTWREIQQWRSEINPELLSQQVLSRRFPMLSAIHDELGVSWVDSVDQAEEKIFPQVQEYARVAAMGFVAKRAVENAPSCEAKLAATSLTPTE